MTLELEQSSYKQFTLCLIIKDDEVLLAKKKRGRDEGKWNGYGGKPNEGESLKQAAIREAQEEGNVTPKNLEIYGQVNYHTPWNMAVTVYLVREWDGIPQETEEMGEPQWFKTNELPQEIHEGDRGWWQKILSGEKVKVDFYYDEMGKQKEAVFGRPKQ